MGNPQEIMAVQPMAFGLTLTGEQFHSLLNKKCAHLVALQAEVKARVETAQGQLDGKREARKGAPPPDFRPAFARMPPMPPRGPVMYPNTIPASEEDYAAMAAEQARQQAEMHELQRLEAMVAQGPAILHRLSNRLAWLELVAKSVGVNLKERVSFETENDLLRLQELVCAERADDLFDHGPRCGHGDGFRMTF